MGSVVWGLCGEGALWCGGSVVRGSGLRALCERLRCKGAPRCGGSVEAAGSGHCSAPPHPQSPLSSAGRSGLWPFSGTGGRKGPDKASGQVI